jgi:hypothetical protein
LKGYVDKSNSRKTVQYKLQSIFDDRAMKFQVYMVAIEQGLLFAADFDNDGWFELVRIDRDDDGDCDVELRSSAKGAPYQARSVSGKERIILPVERAPAQWREPYGRIVSSAVK